VEKYAEGVEKAPSSPQVFTGQDAISPFTGCPQRCPQVIHKDMHMATGERAPTKGCPATLVEDFTMRIGCFWLDEGVLDFAHPGRDGGVVREQLRDFLHRIHHGGVVAPTEKLTDLREGVIGHLAN